MLEATLIVLLISWLAGTFGPVSFPEFAVGGHSLLHILLVVVIVLVILRLVGHL